MPRALFFVQLFVKIKKQSEMYHDLRQRGARIPQDLFIVGFDNHNVKLDSECYLTSIQHSRRKLGKLL